MNTFQPLIAPDDNRQICGTCHSPKALHKDGVECSLLSPWREQEIADHKARLPIDSYTDTYGIIRWKTNNQVPFDDFLCDAGVSLEARQRCAEARSKGNEKFLKNYRRVNRKRKPSAEEMFEMRAAFGRGTEVVNVITGRRTKL